jgi:hypothetical protein
MIIDTEKKVFLTHLRRLIALLVFAVGVLLIMLVGTMPKTFLGLNKYNWALVVSILFVIASVFESIVGLCYVYFSDDKGILTFRYFSLSYFNSNKKLVEIPINEFVRYEITSSMGGLKTTLTLYRLIKNQEAKYPSISLSLLDKVEIAKLIATLDKYAKK